jgi:hypothetical protein
MGDENGGSFFLNDSKAALKSANRVFQSFFVLKMPFSDQLGYVDQIRAKSET